MQLTDHIQEVQTFLQKHEVKPEEALDGIADVLGIKRLDLYLEPARELTKSEVELAWAWAKRRAQREPAAYIRGFVEFCGCRIEVGPDVLIPRQETEILVEEVCRQLKGTETVWDICSGSGCIGIAMKKKLPGLTVVLSDLSPKAVEMAKRNAKANRVEVTCLQGDLFEPFKGKKTDVILFNPPYISEEEFKELEPEVADFEPYEALVGGVSGLELYERFAKSVPKFLKPGARVWCEMGSAQGRALSNLFDLPWVKRTQILKDWASLDRFFFLEA